jgi:hypothetical protein
MDMISMAVGAVGGFVLTKVLGDKGVSALDLEKLAMCELAATEEQLAIAESSRYSNADRQEAAEIAYAFATSGIRAAEKAKSPRYEKIGREYLARAASVTNELAD